MILLLSLSLTACGQVGAFFRSTDHFIELESDERIYYESNALDIALQVAKDLDYSISRIEKEQYRRFKQPIEIYVCGSKESFAKFTGLNNKIKAAVFNGKIFLSASLREQPERIPTLTIHELSHLNLIQQIGTSDYVHNIPSWFVEGMAVCFSGGGGAETVGPAEAALAILNGTSFKPDSNGSLFFPKTASSYQLKPHMFYRQSAMFVQFLKADDPGKFRELLEAIHAGDKFGHALLLSYGRDINFYWKEFRQQLTEMVSTDGSQFNL